VGEFWPANLLCRESFSGACSPQAPTGEGCAVRWSAWRRRRSALPGLVPGGDQLQPRLFNSEQENTEETEAGGVRTKLFGPGHFGRLMAIGRGSPQMPGSLCPWSQFSPFAPVRTESSRSRRQAPRTEQANLEWIRRCLVSHPEWVVLLTPRSQRPQSRAT